MTTGSTTSRSDEIAIFTRNHIAYLREAQEISKKDPTQSITFRAATRWASAAKHLKTRRPRDLYIAPIDGGGSVDFVADLHDIHLDPTRTEPRTKELLAHVLPTTKAEGVWVDGEGTLYVIRNCRKLNRPFLMTELVKVSNRTRLSEDYSYSYSIVYAHSCR